MRKIWLMLVMLALGIGIGLTISARLAIRPSPVEARDRICRGSRKPGIGGSDRSLRSGEELAAGHQHAAGK